MDTSFPVETDKYRHGYVPTYERLAAEIGENGRVCEIGVYQGASLRLWQRLFPTGFVCGVDCNENAIWPQGTGKIVAGQEDPALRWKLSACCEQWDLIVDDASHIALLTQRTFDTLWSLVAPNRFYVIEDGMPGVAGGNELFEFTKSLVDRIYCLRDVESITYRYGQTILRKKL